MERRLTADEVERKHRAQFAPKYCAYCGAVATCMAGKGFWSCDTHKSLPRPGGDGPATSEVVDAELVAGDTQV
jgi:hypothetical protein